MAQSEVSFQMLSNNLPAQRCAAQHIAKPQQLRQSLQWGNAYLLDWRHLVELKTVKVSQVTQRPSGTPGRK